MQDMHVLSLNLNAIPSKYTLRSMCSYKKVAPDPRR